MLDKTKECQLSGTYSMMAHIGKVQRRPLVITSVSIIGVGINCFNTPETALFC